MVRIYSLALVLLLIISVSARPETSWTISPGYLQSYIHHYHLQYVDENGKEVDITNEEFTPLYFYIWTTTANSYSYVLQNYSQIFQHVLIEPKNISGELYELPTGDLPIILPTRFNNRDGWVDYYFDELTNLSSNPELLLELNSSGMMVSQATTTTIYSIDSNFSSLSLSKNHGLRQYLTFLNVIFSLKDFSITNGSLTLDQEYIKRSGVLQNYKLILEGQAVNGTGQVMNNFTLDYEAIFSITLPPLNSETIDFPIIPVIIGIIFLRIKSLKRLFKSL